MTLPGELPANYSTGQKFTAAAEDAVETAVNALTEGNTYTIFNFGAKVDGQRRQDATISSGSLNVVTCAGYNFQASDVGKTIVVGSAASSTANQAHVTTIASLSGNNAVLTAAAGNAVSGAYVVWGTDDGAAWLAAITALTNLSNAQLVMPAGISICGQAISLSPTAGNCESFSLRGASSATSQIISTNAGGFLTLNLSSNSAQSQIDVRDLTIATAIAGATTALTVNAHAINNALQHGFIAEHIVCHGFDSMSGYFAYAIQVLGVMRPLLEDVFVIGLWATSSDYSDTSPLFLASVGIKLDKSYTPQLHYVQVWSCERAIQAISTISNFPQGSYIDDCIAANCRQGFYWEGIGEPPQVTIRGGYYDCRDWNVCFNGWTNGIINDALSYVGNVSGGWNPSSTLATAVNTGTTPTTLTLASTAGFAEAGAVLIGSEWFTYNNLTTGAPGSGMNGTTLNNVARAEFGTADPGTNYAAGATVLGGTADILLIDTNTVRIDSVDFEADRSPQRINVMMQGGNVDCSVTNSRFNADCPQVAISNDNVGAEVLNNSFGGAIQILNGAADTIYVPRRVTAPDVIALSMDSSEPAAISGEGQLYVASDGSLHYLTSAVDAVVATGPGVGWDASSAGNHLTLGASGITDTITIGASATAIAVAVSNFHSSDSYASVTSNSCQIGSTALSLLGYVNNGNAANNGWLEVWGLVFAAGTFEGPQTITYKEVLTGTTYPNTVIGCDSYINVASFGTVVTNYGDSASISTGPVASQVGDRVFVASAGSTTSETVTITGNGTQRYNPTGAASFINGQIQDLAGGTTVQGTATNSIVRNWGTVAVNMVPAFLIVPVSGGGTGAATLTGLVKGNGTAAFSAAVAGTDYVAPLVRTAPKTSAYTASVNDLVIVDCTAGAVTITAPPGAVEGSRFAVKREDATFNSAVVATIARSGSDVFDLAATSTALPLQGEAKTYQYAASIDTWYAVGSDLALSSLDSRYVPLEQFAVLPSAYTLTSQTAAQQLLNTTTNGAITLPVDEYFFECAFSLTGMSATSGSFGFGFGGTATFMQDWSAVVAKSAAGLVGGAASFTWSTANQTVLITANVNPTGTALIKGRINVTAAGTLIPQVSLTQAAGAVVGAGAYFRIQSVNSAASYAGAWS